MNNSNEEAITTEQIKDFDSFVGCLLFITVIVICLLVLKPTEKPTSTVSNVKSIQRQAQATQKRNENDQDTNNQITEMCDFINSECEDILTKIRLQEKQK